MPANPEAIANKFLSGDRKAGVFELTESVKGELDSLYLTANHLNSIPELGFTVQVALGKKKEPDGSTRVTLTTSRPVKPKFFDRFWGICKTVSSSLELFRDLSDANLETIVRAGLQEVDVIGILGTAIVTPYSANPPAILPQAMEKVAAAMAK